MVPYMRTNIFIRLSVFSTCFIAAAVEAAPYYVTDLGTLGGAASDGQAINASGAVTGWSYQSGHSDHHAFLYDGVMHDLGTLGGTESYGHGINIDGQVTGESDTSTGADHAFIYDGMMHDLGTLGGTVSVGSAINASGIVVGHSTLPLNVSEHAFLYDEIALCKTPRQLHTCLKHLRSG